MQVCNLKAYLANIDMKLKDFCSIIEKDPKYISRVVNGKARAGHALARLIKEATSGVVELPTRQRKCDINKHQQDKDPEK